MISKIVASALLLGSAAQGCSVQSNPGDGFFTMRPDQIPSMNVFTKTPMDYIQSSATYDSFRYANTNAFPLKTSWTDAANVQWSVSILSPTDSCTVAVPCNQETMFAG